MLFTIARADQEATTDGLNQSRSADVQRGAALFRSQCAFCHGGDAGGAQGPNLVVSKLFSQDDHATALADFLKSGRPAAGMPPFPSLSSSDVSAIHAFVRSHAGDSQRPAMDPASILVGDRVAGERYFEGEGRCVTCHSASGDLKGIGARLSPVTLQGRMINPRVVGVDRASPDPHPPRVTVYVDRHAEVSGELVQINDFFVTLKDDTGARRTFEREGAKVKVDDPAAAHLQGMLRWTDQNMWNVTAYLASLK